MNHGFDGHPRCWREVRGGDCDLGSLCAGNAEHAVIADSELAVDSDRLSASHADDEQHHALNSSASLGDGGPTYDAVDET
jgi:hypothetical protein